MKTDKLFRRYFQLKVAEQEPPIALAEFWRRTKIVPKRKKTSIFWLSLAFNSSLLLFMVLVFLGNSGTTGKMQQSPHLQYEAHEWWDHVRDGLDNLRNIFQTHPQ